MKQLIQLMFSRRLQDIKSLDSKNRPLKARLDISLNEGLLLAALLKDEHERQINKHQKISQEKNQEYFYQSNLKLIELKTLIDRIHQTLNDAAKY